MMGTDLMTMLEAENAFQNTLRRQRRIESLALSDDQLASERETYLLGILASHLGASEAVVVERACYFWRRTHDHWPNEDELVRAVSALLGFYHQLQVKMKVADHLVDAAVADDARLHFLEMEESGNRIFVDPDVVPDAEHFFLALEMATGIALQEHQA